MPTGPQLVKGRAAVVVGVLTGVLCVGAGGFGAWWATGRLSLASEGKSFEAVPAQVLAIGVQEHRGDGTEAPTFSPVVRYAFELGGERHESDQFAVWAPRFMSEGDLHSFLGTRGVRVGGEVEAYVDPVDPGRSVLSRDVSGKVVAGMWALTAAGLASVGVGAGLIAGLAMSARFRALVMGRSGGGARSL